MPTLISNCADANSLAAAFTKAEKYAADNNFKMGKSKNDVSKMMAACAAATPPDRPEVKFEDAGKTMMATVGKAKKSVLVIATKEQAATDPKPILHEIEASLKDIIAKVTAQAQAMATKATAIEHFMGVGQEGCNALYVLIKEMQARGTKGDKLIDFKANANAITFAKEITQNGINADVGIHEWDALAQQATAFQTILGTVEAKMKVVAAIMVKPEHIAQVKAVQTALANMKKGLADIMETDIPRGAGFLKLDGNTPVADIELKAGMSFKDTLKALELRKAQGTETAKALREQHTGEALKHIQALANMA